MWARISQHFIADLLSTRHLEQHAEPSAKAECLHIMPEGLVEVAAIGLPGPYPVRLNRRPGAISGDGMWLIDGEALSKLPYRAVGDLRSSR